MKINSKMIQDTAKELQLTKATDWTIPVTAGTQIWVQDGTHLATWSVLVSRSCPSLSPSALAQGSQRWITRATSICPRALVSTLGM